MTEDTTPPDRMLVRDLMAVGVPTCALDTKVADLARLMVEKGWEAVVVLESDQGHAVGFVSRNEMMRAYAGMETDGLTAEQIMHDGLPTVPPDIPLAAAAQIMLDMGVRGLFMTHHAGGIEYPAAWLTDTQLLRHMAGDNLDDLGIRAGRELPLETFIKRRDEARRKAGLTE